jgi:hypothetical protein
MNIGVGRKNATATAKTTTEIHGYPPLLTVAKATLLNLAIGTARAFGSRWKARR